MYLEGQLNQGLDALEESASSSSDWLHGDTITLADITTVCLIDYLSIRMPENIKIKGMSALLALSEKANAIDAIGKTRPNI
jgi:glutathione S-transferase